MTPDFFVSLKEFLNAFQALGPWGVIFFLWWDGKKERQKDDNKWRDRFESVVKMFESSERRYENNVVLVKNYEKIANEHQDLIIMNTQAITEISTILRAREL